MYKSTVTDIGPLVEDLASEGGFYIVFNDNAPASLAEMAVLHTAGTPDRDMAPGDTVILGGKEFTITAVGDEANHTFSTMGHMTIKFSGLSEVELPGQIEVDGGGTVPPVKAGDAFEIVYA